MLFNSYQFIFLFLPLALLVFFKIGTIGHHRVAIAWLVGASLFFYGWWNPSYLWLIVFSILFNYSFGLALSAKRSKKLLAIGIACNLCVLGYYKYTNFFIKSYNYLLGYNFHVDAIILPLAISFFTFQQITYLVDTYRGETLEYNFLHYCLFVTFFPQLIAGPIVHHREILPQFLKNKIYRFSHENIAVGLTFFFMGLFKKIIIADEIARYANSAFGAALQGVPLTFFEAWRGAFAYTFQIYFDFSGYSDMAIGLGRLFGIIIPINFFSPYKSINIIDFWRRWHITLSRFLKDYLYIPLGGNKKSLSRTFTNLMATMLLGGLWHGAGWTYILWGGLHGVFLVVNHSWRMLRTAFGHDYNKQSTLGAAFSRSLTLLLIVLSWVLFRAETFDAASVMLKGMMGYHGIFWPANSLPTASTFYHGILNDIGLQFGYTKHFKGFRDIAIILFLIAFTWLLPNTHQLLHKFHPLQPSLAPQSSSFLQWQPNKKWLVFIWVIAIVSILKLSDVSEFLYFQF